MKLLLVYPPFCTPAIIPYSLVNLYSFLKANSVAVDVLDLNLEFHDNHFHEYKEFVDEGDYGEYDEKTKEFLKETKDCYSKNNKKVVNSEEPELFVQMLALVKEKKPDVVGFSVVYSSQVFYAYALMKRLKAEGVKVVVGGPAVNDKIISVADKHLNNEIELLSYLNRDVIDYDSVVCEYRLDYEIFDSSKYFCKETVVPLKTSHGCYYSNCAFCTHHKGEMYLEYNISNIESTIKTSQNKFFFLIDDMIPKTRITEIASIMKKYNKKWTCQLRPTKEYDIEALKLLKESGCKMIIWGVESGCQRVLNLMRKGTNVGDVHKVLNDSKSAGILNVVYVMFGFPTETADELEKTVKFLENNKKAIDLVSTSVFGLQKGSDVYENPSIYKIKKVKENHRTILEPKISYEAEGMTKDKLKIVRKTVQPRINAINKYPKSMNFFREHMLIS